jgi:hypothetical protein
VICSQDVIGQLAVRIERAYCRKYPKWLPIGLTPGMWESASSRLVEASKRGSNIPVDPELFVAVQVRSRLAPDPWVELTQQRSLNRYIKALRRIIGQLRRELKGELDRAERCLRRGVELDDVLAREGSRLSPLSRLILAHRAGRLDLTQRHLPAALRQHRSCPLYSLAARSLLPSHAYPSSDLAIDPTTNAHEIISFSLN